MIMNKRFKLYQQVVLSKDLPRENLQKGDVATIVEIIEKENKTGFCLEFFDNEGSTLKVIVVDESFVNEIKHHSLLITEKLKRDEMRHFMHKFVLGGRRKVPDTFLISG